MNNNVGVSAPATTVILQGPDLEVVSFTVDSVPPILSGHSIQLSWEVENFGTAIAPNWSWQDAVYLFNGRSAVYYGWCGFLCTAWSI